MAGAIEIKEGALKQKKSIYTRISKTKVMFHL